MTPRFLSVILLICMGSTLALAGNVALAAGDTRDDTVPATLSPGGDSSHSGVSSTSSAKSAISAAPIVVPEQLLSQQSTSGTSSERSSKVAVPWLPSAANAVSSATDVVSPGYLPLSSSISVAQMGQPQGMTLAGGQAQTGIIFTLPEDLVVTNAHLDLALRVSPELAELNTSLQLMLNGQPLGSVPLNAAAGETANYQLDIPPAMIVSNNNLSFRIDSADRLQCERDSATHYNLTILPSTRLQLEGQQLDLGTRISHFPRPFIDPLRMTPTAVSMVFPAEVTPAQVSAAALVASWLGLKMDGRGVTFPVLRDSLPQKNGIVFGLPGERIGTLTLPQVTSPTLQLVNNPINPVYKLMLVIGNDEGQLRQAAYRLVSQPLTGDGSSLTVTPQMIPLRKAYDAPRWITTDHPVRLSDLLRKDQSMTVSGIWHDALHINFRAAPDLFLWDGQTIPVQLDYRFPAESWIDEDHSFLNVMLNGTFLHNLTVDKAGILQHLWRKLGGDIRQESYTLKVDPYLIYGYNQFQLYFNIHAKADAPCNALLSNNIKSQILGSSFIDLTKTRHFTMLPNLSYFIGAAYPFSRLADYAQTVMMLPKTPSNVEISLLLDLAGRAGDTTGVSLNHNHVMFGMPSSEAERQKLDNSDVLAVSSLQQTGFNQRMLADSPYNVNNHMLGVSTPNVWEHLRNLLSGDWGRSSMEADRYFSSNGDWRGFISYRSPWSPQRVVVMATGSSDEQLLKLYSDLNSPHINAAVRGDTTIITDENGARSFRVGPQFPRGEMPWYLMLVWYASQHSALLAVLGLLLATILGMGLTGVLKRQAKKRLSSRRDSGTKQD
ncbi:cellulose biosynthesis cyclic di-GMP-binding regulatory protein BcsB [Prodigiosinella confusarubida]|uniref:Cyclic di-GMP-binding protein n=1 Tax=Serratia sp. (strain ATCC 39006) TaxID=104623 RepID=A0A2I5TF81_SERS3|nr:cellulose biosynthesis cyclic di-GMP-binding regulatory protein BcsB [Serratia sp. ATCC 39006]AUG98908.1 cellulose biosynthesis cyclic di-GMP-binding regulatory protein BcsB [Serratia sp. ATCC 39006]AUH03223.1 cellulose biosynthesis cyclic di-GMP-binding regulatory protein BcsB [Serratia sp. ATCC 39006]